MFALRFQMTLLLYLRRCLNQGYPISLLTFGQSKLY